jgi:transcriptional regulator with XRE-family HTH domain
MESAGEKLKRIRQRLKLTYREVEVASEIVAERRGNEEYVVALSRLSDIENKGTIPSIFRVYSLCAIYRVDPAEMLSWFGIDLANLPGDTDVIKQPVTHEIAVRVDNSASIQVPFALDPGIDLTRTVFLSRAIQRWGKLPLLLLQNTDLRSYRYGWIGTDDWSMYPLIPPSSLVVIDESRDQISGSGWASEFERPIYFLEHRDGYACGWCVERQGRLIVQFHPSSGREAESFDAATEVDVIGRVTAVAMSLLEGSKRRLDS